MDQPTTKIATFAGGCFWCMEGPFDALEGVHSTISGYTGGEEANPTYEQVSAGATSHFEAIQVTFDPSKVSYQQLLDVFWRNIDPTDPGGQFADRGDQYRTAIFYHDAVQLKHAQDSKSHLETSGKFNKPLVTQILPAKTFYPAEDYHQDYYLKNPSQYKRYRVGSGRERYLDETWD